MSDRAQHQAEIDALREQLAQIAARLSELERPGEPHAGGPPGGGAAARATTAPSATTAPAVEPAPGDAAEEDVPEEVVTVIAAAVAAFLGERARVRQVRLVSSPMWAQQGRVAIQASHRLER